MKPAYKEPLFERILNWNKMSIVLHFFFGCLQKMFFSTRITTTVSSPFSERLLTGTVLMTDVQKQRLN